MAFKLWVMTCMAVCLSWGSSLADIVEIRDEGYVNGEVVSVDADGVLTLKDSEGNLRKIRKVDILYIEKEEPKPGKTKRWKETLQKGLEKITQPFKGVAEPVQRSENKPLNAFIQETSKAADEALANKNYLEKKQREAIDKG